MITYVKYQIEKISSHLFGFIFIIKYIWETFTLYYKLDKFLNNIKLPNTDT